MNKEIVVILGMHRSGTSALTRVLNLLGLGLGDELVPAEHDNPKGFWEDARIVAAHDRFFHAIDRDSADPRAIAPPLWERPAAFAAREELLQTLSTYDSQQSRWAIKDPRLCRLLPLWRPIFEQVGRRPRFLLTVRNPLEVADSLFAREQLPVHRGLLLWLIYNLDALTHTRNDSRVIVSFNQLLSDWPSVVSKVQDGLELPCPAEDPRARAAIEAFLDPQLRHHRTPPPGRPALPAAAIDSLLLRDWTATVYDLLQSAAHDPQSVIDPEIHAIAERVYRRLADLDRFSASNTAPHYHRWFAEDTAWDFIQKSDQRLAQALPSISIPLSSLLGPCYKLRSLFATARRALP